MISDGRQAKPRPVKPPPDYSSRRVQLRLLALTATLMFVLAAMFEARKPERWHWLWAFSETPREVTSGQLDTRVASSGGSNGFGAVTITRPPARSIQPGESVDRQVSEEAWAWVTRQLSDHDLGNLDRVLEAARVAAPRASIDADQWTGTLTGLSEQWNAYFAELDERLDASPVLSEDTRQRLDALVRMKERWSVKVHPAFLAATAGWNDDDRATLMETGAAVDSAALAVIEDDTVARYPERRAWFRLLARLRTTPLEQIAGGSVGEVGFLQLYRQPTEYRGKIVTVRGVARLGYRVAAPKNSYGIEGYYVFWVKPAGGQLSPYLVYCLDLPLGFPSIGEKSTDGTGQTLSEPIGVSGYFFKRQVYRAQDGPNSAPVLLAKTPVWAPPPPPSERPRISSVWFGVALVAVAALAIGLTVLARGPRNRFQRGPGALPDGNLQILEKIEVAPTTEEALQRMREQE